MNQIRRNYLIPMILVLLFAAPGLAAYAFYHHPQWLGEKKTNRGELLNPPIALPQEINPDSKWQLILWSPFACDKSCEDQIDKLARIRLTLGRRLYDVETMLLLGSEAAPVNKTLAGVLADQAIKTSQLNETQYPLQKLPEHLEIYIQNPTGYLVLAYDAQTNPKDIHLDLKRLLNIKE